MKATPWFLFALSNWSKSAFAVSETLSSEHWGRNVLLSVWLLWILMLKNNISEVHFCFVFNAFEPTHHKSQNRNLRSEKFVLLPIFVSAQQMQQEQAQVGYIWSANSEWIPLTVRVNSNQQIITHLLRLKFKKLLSPDKDTFCPQGGMPSDSLGCAGTSEHKDTLDPLFPFANKVYLPFPPQTERNRNCKTGPTRKKA